MHILTNKLVNFNDIDLDFIACEYKNWLREW